MNSTSSDKRTEYNGDLKAGVSVIIGVWWQSEQGKVGKVSQKEEELLSSVTGTILKIPPAQNSIF